MGQLQDEKQQEPQDIKKENARRILFLRHFLFCFDAAQPIHAPFQPSQDRQKEMPFTFEDPRHPRTQQRGEKNERSNINSDLNEFKKAHEVLPAMVCMTSTYGESGKSVN